MTKLDIEEVRKLAALSKLTLTPDEEIKYKSQIEDVFEHIDRLLEVDTEGVEPTIQIGSLSNVTRPDKVKTSSIEKSALIGAQKNDGDSISVPRVL